MTTKIKNAAADETTAAANNNETSLSAQDQKRLADSKEHAQNFRTELGAIVEKYSGKLAFVLTLTYMNGRLSDAGAVGFTFTQACSESTSQDLFNHLEKVTQNTLEHLNNE